jgi:hypothetical protein
MDKNMAGRTQTTSAQRQPSRTALATRSLRNAHRLRDAGKRDEYREALAEHFAQFITTPSRSSCPLRSF